MSKTLADSFKEAGFDAGRGGGYTLVDPEALVVVTDPAHFLFDVRVHDELDEDFIKELMDVGVHTPIRVFPNGLVNGKPNVLVVAGRRRTLHLREANKRLAKLGRPAFRIPAISTDGDDKSLLLISLSENAHRKDETIEGRAAKVMKALAIGCTEAEVARALGASFTTVKQLRQFSNLTPSAQASVKAKEIPLGAVSALADVPREKQAEVIAAVKKTGATKTHEIKPAVKAVMSGATVALPERKKMMSRKEIDSIIEHISEASPDAEAELVTAVLRATQGDLTALRKKGKKFVRYFE